MPSSSPESSHHAHVRLPAVSGTGSRQALGDISGLGLHGGQRLNVAEARVDDFEASRARATGSKRALRGMQLPGIRWWDGDDPSGKLFGGSAGLI